MLRVPHWFFDRQQVHQSAQSRKRSGLDPTQARAQAAQAAQAAMAARFRSASHATMFGRKKVEGFTDMNEATRYMEGTQLTRALAECMAIIMSEQPADPVERMSELLARWGTAGRENELDLGDVDPKFEVAIVQFKVPGVKNGGTDKGPDGNRIDSIPIANGITKVGGHCDLPPVHRKGKGQVIPQKLSQRRSFARAIAECSGRCTREVPLDSAEQ